MPRAQARIPSTLRRLLLAVALVALAALVAACADDRSSPASADGAFVERVVDGDTLVVTVDGVEERVRLIGVDTPETKHPSKPVECFGEQASAFTASLLAPGTEVRLERDVEARDRYDRLLAYVYRADDGLFVNRELLAQGYAAVLTVPPNVAHADEFVGVAADAREAGRGLWSACGDVGVPAE